MAPCRIMVVGPSGGGKSTAAVRIGTALDLPVHHLDRLTFAPGWIEKPEADWIDELEAIVATDAWVIDGNDSSTMNRRLARADAIVFIDTPPLRRLVNVLRRNLAYRGTTRPDMAPGNPERLNLEFLSYVARWDHGPRRKVEAKLAGHEDRIVRLKTPHALDDWIAAATRAA